MHVVQSRVLLRPTDFARSTAFYDDQLELVRYREWGRAPHRGVVYFLGGGYLELAETPAGQPPPAAPEGVRLWLQVGDIAAAHRRLRDRDVAILEPPARKPWGLLEMVVADPDGLQLVVVETPMDHPLRRRD